MLSCCDFQGAGFRVGWDKSGATEIGRKLALVNEALGHLTRGVLLSAVLIVASLQIIHQLVVTVVARVGCVVGHGGLPDVVPPRLRVLPVRGGEEEYRRGQGDQEGPQAAEEEGEERD